ncbi:hypothetical protein AAMO2058_000671200 [Amorphochlora amoebiformis]
MPKRANGSFRLRFQIISGPPFFGCLVPPGVKENQKIKFFRLRTMLGALSRVTGWRGGRALSVSRSIHSLIKYDHDIGGSPSLTDAKIDTREETILLWERKVDATLSLLVSKKLLTTDELRRAIEGLPAYHQNTLGYYEKWAIALSTLMLENGVISHDDLLPNPLNKPSI